MKALSIRQPWAYAILHLGKMIENRSRRTSYRGIIAIHASRRYDQEGETFLKSRGFSVPMNLPSGGIVGTVHIIGCIGMDNDLRVSKEHSWFTGPFGYMLDSPRTCQFMPVPGKLGFFNVSDDQVIQNAPKCSVCGKEGVLTYSEDDPYTAICPDCCDRRAEHADGEKGHQFDYDHYDGWTCRYCGISRDCTDYDGGEP